MQRIKCQRCVIHEIAKFNKWDALFPNNDTSLDNVKTNEIIREHISKEFHLQVKNNPSDRILLKKVYNAYFKTDVIKTRTNDADKKHYHYYIPDELREMYKFGMERLRPLPVDENIGGNDDLMIEEDDTDEP